MQSGFIKQQNNGIITFAPASFAQTASVTAAFTTRVGGASSGCFTSLNLSLNRGDERQNVLNNYERLAYALGLNTDCFALTRQVHGNQIKTLDENDRGRGFLLPVDYEADGLVTNSKGLCLVGLFADCVPVLLYDPIRRIAAMVHAGWRGTAKKIVEEGITAMCERFDCKREDIIAAIGPSIGGCCFQTDDDVPKAMGQGAQPYIKAEENGKYRVDLKGINHMQLKASGLSEKNISVSKSCTCCEGELFYSHRRDGEARGSLAAVIAIREVT